MRFFEREAKLQLYVSAFLLVPLGLTVLYFFACQAVEIARVDDCLDRGGRFNFEQQTCEFE